MPRLNEKRKNSRLEIGQSLVEMTFGSILLLIILSGLVDIGRLYFIYVALEDAAGEAALYMSIYPDAAYQGSFSDSCSGMMESAACRAKTASDGDLALNWSGHGDNDIQVDLNSGSAGDIVEVTLTYHFSFITPIVQAMVPGGLNLTADAQQTIVREL